MYQIIAIGMNYRRACWEIQEQRMESFYRECIGAAEGELEACISSALEGLGIFQIRKEKIGR